jgi:hypothetical protein
MKKIIITISALVIVALIIIKVTNAQASTQGNKNSPTEAKMGCGKGQPITGCAKMSDSKMTEGKVCDHSKCKEGKCDTAKCKMVCAEIKTGLKNCEPAKCRMITQK